MLDLPVSTTEMMYEVDVTRADLEAAEKAALAACRLLTHYFDNLICPITQESLGELHQPVAVGPTSSPRVYECENLLRWWQDHGKEPAPADGCPLSLSDFLRPLRVVAGLDSSVGGESSSSDKGAPESASLNKKVLASSARSHRLCERAKVQTTLATNQH